MLRTGDNLPPRPVGNTPLVELGSVSHRKRAFPHLRGSSKARIPTGSIKDRVAKAMIENRGGVQGDLEAGPPAARAHKRQHRDLARPRREAEGLPAHLRWLSASNATEERIRVLRL